MRQELVARQINTKQEAVSALENDSPTNNLARVTTGASLTGGDSIDEFVTADGGVLSASASPAIPGAGRGDGPAGAGSAADERRLGSGPVPMIRPGVSRDAFTASPTAATAATNEDEKQQLTMAHLHELETTLGLDEAKVRFSCFVLSKVWRFAFEGTNTARGWTRSEMKPLTARSMSRGCNSGMVKLSNSDSTERAN